MFNIKLGLKVFSRPAHTEQFHLPLRVYQRKTTSLYNFFILPVTDLYHYCTVMWVLKHLGELGGTSGSGLCDGLGHHVPKLNSEAAYVQQVLVSVFNFFF